MKPIDIEWEDSDRGHYYDGSAQVVPDGDGIDIESIRIERMWVAGMTSKYDAANRVVIKSKSRMPVKVDAMEPEYVTFCKETLWQCREAIEEAVKDRLKVDAMSLA